MLLGFECSAGIAHNKILAKLVCGMNKPNKQTVLPVKNVSLLFRCVAENLSFLLMTKPNTFSLNQQ